MERLPKQTVWTIRALLFAALVYGANPISDKVVKMAQWRVVPPKWYEIKIRANAKRGRR